MNATELATFIQKHKLQYDTAKKAGTDFGLSLTQYAQLIMIADIEQRVAQMEGLENQLIAAEQAINEERQEWQRQFQEIEKSLKTIMQGVSSAK